jgi:hypothetical protein
MGRGRAKAKQTRVARDLKYRDVGTDLSQLANELRKAGPGTTANGHAAEASDDDASEDEEDPYAEYSTYGGDVDEFESGDDGGTHRSHHRRG